MDTSKLPLNKFSFQLAVFTLLFSSLVLPSGVYSNPSDVIIEYPAGFETGIYDSVITFDSVRNELSADGEWIKVNQDEIDSESVTDGSTEFDDDINTDYVWRPNNVDENWSPYTNGYWTYTNCGWMWVSYYEWGWRPYHYGRWWWSPRWGWVWSPGFIWAPAWVVWMFYDGYYGWYPLSPRVRWRHHHHHHGYHCHHMRFRVRHWHFCHSYNFTNVYINHTVLIDPSENAGILKYSKFSSDLKYAEGIVTNKGPDVREVEKSAGKKIVAEDVTKYNTTKKVNEIVKRSAEEIQKIEKQVKENQTYREKRESNVDNEKQVNKEEKKTTREDNWEKNPYYGPPKESNENKSEEKKEETVNKNEEREYKKQESPKQETPKYEVPKQEAPKQEKKNESPPPNKENNEKKNDNNNNKQNNKPNEGVKQDGKR